jgi:hypothetical protein
VIAGPNDPVSGARWYFSLNNRRLWVLKRCREEGLLANNQILVRVRSAKSASEALRYSLDNCAVEAKFMRERDSNANEPSTTNDGVDDPLNFKEAKGDLEQILSLTENSRSETEHEEREQDSSEEDISLNGRRNPFATTQGEASDDSDDTSDDDLPRARGNQFNSLLF